MRWLIYIITTDTMIRKHLINNFTDWASYVLQNCHVTTTFISELFVASRLIGVANYFLKTLHILSHLKFL
jgi:citrate synthase